MRCEYFSTVFGPHKISSIDDSIYRSILRAVRRDEQLRGGKMSYAFIIQEEDVREIIENIWHGHSILSQCDVRKELRWEFNKKIKQNYFQITPNCGALCVCINNSRCSLPRWDVSKEWSPWNCILLNDSEARTHVRITDLRSIYGEALLKNVKNKHRIGAVNFSRLRDMD